VLETLLAEAPPDGGAEVGWVTGRQQWAMRSVVAAGLELSPCGAVMVRGMDGPPCCYLPSGAYG
jgi:hypothetical protein